MRPGPDTVNGRVLAFIETCDEPVGTAQIVEATGLYRSRVVTACSELSLAGHILRQTGAHSFSYARLAIYPALPAEGARPGLYLAPCIGFKVHRDSRNPASSVRRDRDGQGDSLAA